MRHWLASQFAGVVAVLLVAAAVLVLESWTVHATPTMFKNCTYTRTTTDGSVRPPYSLAPLLGSVKVTLKTDRGTLELRLDRENAPCAVHSFTHLALQRYYNGTPCPRRTRAILECGAGRPGYQFPAELTGKENYHRGVVALRNEGAGNGSTFFLVHGVQGAPTGSTIIGVVTNNLTTLDHIAAHPVQIQQILIG
ncbi:peptidylprolyl isomerase [Kribbella sp. NBC_01505]|uniref:peptidylprolyl isomerase n=1 Tax=Kribbella sp. NBC_01505 TaxID=2903580 RepID=UPI00386DFEE5